MYILGVILTVIIGGLAFYLLRKHSRKGTLPRVVIYIIFPLFCLFSWFGLFVVITGFIVFAIVYIIESDWWQEEI